MSGRKLSELPEGRYSSIAKLAMERGVAIDSGLNGTDILVLGLCDILAEILETGSVERIKKLTSGN